jgi:hypothetical protein
MKISVTPWAAIHFGLFVLAVLGILLAPPAITASAWLLLLAVPLVFWIKGSFDASLPPGDRSINRALAALALIVIAMKLLGEH